MAAKTNSLLIHCHLISEDGSLRQNTALVDGSIGQDLLQLGFQSCPVVHHSLGISLLHLGHQFQNGLATAAQVIFQRHALRAAHGIVALDGFGHHAHQIGLQLILIGFGPLHAEHLRQPGHSRNADVIGHAVVGDHLPHSGQISFQHGAVQGDLDFLISLGTDGDKHIHLATGNSSLHRLLHGFLRKGQASGQLHAAIQIAIVDGAKLHCKLTAIDRFHSPAITGHAFNQLHYPLFSRLRDPPDNRR